MATAAPQPHIFGLPDRDGMGMGMGIYQGQATPVSSQSTKLLDPKNMKSLMLRNFEACSRLPRRDQAPPVPGSEHVAPRVDGRRSAPSVLTNSAENDRHEPDEVQRLLALDINELLRHTSKVQRERHHHRLSSYYSFVSICERVGAAPLLVMLCVLLEQPVRKVQTLEQPPRKMLLLGEKESRGGADRDSRS